MRQVLKKYLYVLIITLLGTIILLPPIWRENISHADADLLLKLRGDRPVSDKILFVYIDSRDATELGGWPISRDYYGYLVHILNEAGARVIGIDVLFAAANSRYPEHDADLAQFLRVAKNVCLPFVFGDLSNSFRGADNSYLLGANPQFPIEDFRQHLLGTGFSNLPEETVARQGLLAAAVGDSLCPAFGLESARLFLYGPESTIRFHKNKIIIGDDSTAQMIKTDKFYRVLLNQFGDPAKIPAISLIDLFQTWQKNPDGLDVKNKLVFVGVTAPGAAPMQVTPLSPAFPATLLQFTLAENIISDNLLRTLPALITLFLVAAFAGFVAIFFSLKWKNILATGAALIVYVLVATFLFKFSAVVLPIMLPVAAAFLTVITFIVLSYRQKSTAAANLYQLYAGQIETKEAQLAQAEAQRHALTAENQQLLDDKQQEILRLEKELRDLRAGYAAPLPVVKEKKYEKIIHAPDSALTAVLELVDKVSSDDIPVLISGETGAGKEVIARAIHESGKRAAKQFVAVNCGALPETLLESELFGHEKGAFTGATTQRKGRFELADGGTLFLDEITETTAAFQAKLLRVLQEGTFERLGSEKTLKVNVRVIAASSKNIPRQVEAGLFREDLFYRLNGFPIELPPLRQRQSDIPLLAGHFLRKHGYKNIEAFSERALEVMRAYSWPGNVRELENAVRRAAILAQSENRAMIQEIDLPQHIRAGARESLDISYQSLDEQILETLRSLRFSHSSIGQTAQALGNKDRSTVTEYFRGLCFKFYIEADFDRDLAAQRLANTTEPQVVEKVKSKMTEYLGKIKGEAELAALQKGLPKKYHGYVEQIRLYFAAQHEKSAQ